MGFMTVVLLFDVLWYKIYFRAPESFARKPGVP